MELKLYELSGAYNQLMELDLDDQQLQDALASIQGDVAVKAENIAKAMRTMELEEEAFKSEIKRLQDMVKAKANRRESLKSYLDHELKNMDIKKLDAGVFKISYRKSTSVNITDESAVPSDFKTEVVSEKIDKMAIKKALSNGEIIEGAELEVKQNLQIK